MRRTDEVRPLYTVQASSLQRWFLFKIQAKEDIKPSKLDFNLSEETRFEQ